MSATSSISNSAHTSTPPSSVPSPAPSGMTIVSPASIEVLPKPERAPRSTLLSRVVLLINMCIATPVIPLLFWLWAWYRVRGVTRLGWKAFMLGRFFNMLSTTNPFVPAQESYRTASSIPMKIARQARKRGVAISIVTVQPAPAEVIKGIQLPLGVRGTTRPAFLLTPTNSLGKSAEPAKEGEKLIFYCHGGGYILGHPFMSDFPINMARAAGARVLCVQYRKCLSNATAYPAPLLDALAAWHYATTILGFPPSSIVFQGDSAGGNLALGLANHLASISTPSNPTLPGGLTLASPWVDLTRSFPSWNSKSDYLNYTHAQRAVAAATRHYGKNARGATLFSPALAPAGTWSYLAQARVPVYMWFGDEEVFADEITALANTMRGDGVDVTTTRQLAAVHCVAILTNAKNSHKAYMQGFMGVIGKMRSS